MLFKILHGDESRISTDVTPFHEGWAYVTNTGKYYVDMNIGTVDSPNNQRVQLNAANCETLCGKTLEEIKTEIMGDIDIPEYSAAGTALGLVQSGGDVTISSGVISVNGNAATSETHTKTVTILKSENNSVTTNLVNDNSFAGLVTNLRVASATLTTEDQSDSTWEYDGTNEDGYHYNKNDSGAHIIPYEVIFNGNVPTGEFECSLIGMQFCNYPSSDELFSEKTDSGDEVWEIDGCQIYLSEMYFDHNGFNFFIHTWDIHESSDLIFAPWIYFTLTIKGTTKTLDPSHLNIARSGNSAIVSVKTTAPDYSEYASIAATIQYTTAFGSDLNTSNTYPYFNNLAASNLKPVAGDAIKPATTQSYDLGTSSKRWRAIYADSLDGTAAMAIADAAGNDIQATYAKKSEIGNTPDSGSSYTLPTASSTTLGGVKIGSNITNSNGTISLTKTNVTNALSYTPANESHIHNNYLENGGNASFSELIVSGDFIAQDGSNFELGEGVALTLDGVNVGDNLVNKIGSIDTWADDFCADIDTSGGISWTEQFSLYSGQNLDGNNLAQGAIMHRIPIIAGNNVTFEVDDQAGTVSINATGGGSSTTPTNVSLGQGYGTCSVAATTTVKTVTITGYKLAAGGVAVIRFTQAVPANATLNISGTGAKPIYFGASIIQANVIRAGDTATFMYDGTSAYRLLSIDRWHTDIANLESRIAAIEEAVGCSL